jgi:hypothetical protein
MAAPKEKSKVFLLPEGLVLVANLGERDVYKNPEGGAEGKPKYKVVLAFDAAQVEGEGTIEDAMADAVAAAYGDAVAEEWLDKTNVTRIRPQKDGDAVSREREEKGKDGAHTKGKLVISADSIYNKDGQEGPGGFSVYGPDTAPIAAMDITGETYAGSYGIAAVTISTYKDYPRKGDRGVKLYLTAFQKTRNGPKLSSGGDNSGLFKAVAGTTAPVAGSRRRGG